MRSAPGLPMASTAPSSRRPTVGAMLLGSRSPGAGRVPRFSSCSPRQLFSHSPVPGSGRAGPVAVRRGDRAGAAACCRPRTRAPCSVTQQRSSRPREQVQRRSGAVVGHVQAVAAGVQHPPLHGDQVRHVRLRPGTGRPVAEQRQHRRQHRTAQRRGRVGAQVPGTGADRERGAHDRAVGSEVGRRHEPAASRHVGREQPGQLTVVQGAGALLGDQGQRRGQPVDHHRVAGLDPATIGSAQRPRRLGVPAEAALADVREVVARRRPQREAGPGDLGGRRHHLGPRQCPEPGLGQVEGGQRAGDRRGARADRHGHAAAVAGAHLLHRHRRRPAGPGRACPRSRRRSLPPAPRAATPSRTPRRPTTRCRAR